MDSIAISIPLWWLVGIAPAWLICFFYIYREAIRGAYVPDDLMQELSVWLLVSFIWPLAILATAVSFVFTSAIKPLIPKKFFY